MPFGRMGVSSNIASSDRRALAAERLERTHHAMRDARAPALTGMWRSAVPETINELLRRTHNRVAASHERCLAAHRRDTLTMELVAVSRDLIKRSRARIALVSGTQPISHRAPRSGMRNR